VSSPASPLLATHANCLPVGSRVADFEIIGLIGEGGFGIVYLARDTSLDRVVALKEFMPAAFAGRVDGVRVAVRAANHSATFDAGLKSFINEAKMLAKFAHPALVEVFRFWEGNGTAYMAMRMYRGETLRQALTKGELKFDEENIAQIMGPIFDALEMLHREQVFHRDIAPDNIMLSEGRSVLLDFGSARRIIGDATQALTTVLKPGYAPVEQYSDDGTMKQGAWTDVYALGGVLYHLATGKVPMQAVSRMLSDPLQTVNQVTKDAFSATFSQAVAKAMSVHIDDRFQTVTEFREALGWNVGLQPRVVTLPNAPRVWLEPETASADSSGGSGALGATDASAAESAREREPAVRAEPRPDRTASGGGSRVPMVIAGVSLALLLVAGYFWMGRTGVVAPPPAPTAASSAVPSTVTPVETAPAPTPAPTPQSAPAPAPAASAAEGVVKFDIKPWGTVVVDGVTRGVSPPLKQLQLPVGTHTIEIANPPATPIKRAVDVTADTPFVLSHTFK
jgi:serine/threonine protein kinase